MFYYEPEAVTYKTVQEFLLAHWNISFGNMYDQTVRQSAGLYDVDETPPTFDQRTHIATPTGAVEEVSGGYARVWDIVELPVEDIRANTLAAASAKRWDVETGGITLPNSIVVGTTIDDQNRITSVVANAQLAGVTTVDFKAASGWVSLTLVQVQGIAAAIAQHVQQCFSAEKQHHEDIASADRDALLSYDLSKYFPSTTAS